MKIIYALLLALSISSCHKIKSSDLTIADKIVLGGHQNSFYKQLDSLHVKSQTFYTNLLFKDVDEIKNSVVKVYYSEAFNLKSYSLDSSENHYGIIYPSINDNSYVVGMHLLLVNTAKSMLEPSFQLTENTGFLGLKQCIRIDLLNRIQEMMIAKYGQPTEIINSKDSCLYVIEKNTVKQYISDTKYSGEIVKWKTKYMDISFFKGFKSNTGVYSKKIGYYYNLVTSTGNLKINNDDISTNELPYIQYQLNSNAIKELKLNTVNL